MIELKEITKRKLIIPNVVGISYDRAVIILNNVGFYNLRFRFQESYEPINRVVSQAPIKGLMVESDEEIILIISRVNYIRYLPSIFQKNTTTENAFLMNFLWIIQHQKITLDEQIDSIHNIFQPFESDTKFLPWLSSWVALVIDDNWPENKKRAIIKNAMELYKIRGTVKGLKLFLKIFTGVEPEIMENQWPFKGFRIGVTSTISIDSIILPPINLSHCFIVIIPMSFTDCSNETVIKIHDIINQEKPAHSIYFLEFSIDQDQRQLREFYAIGVRSHVNLGDEIIEGAELGEENEPTQVTQKGKD